MRIAVDTNVFGYAAGIGQDDVKRGQAEWFLKAIRPADLVMPTQVAGEFYNILVKKGGYPPMLARKIVEDWSRAVSVAAPTTTSMLKAIETAGWQDLQIWDALIVVIAAEAGCQMLLSEDFQDGFVCRGVTIVNPFAETLHPLLSSLRDRLLETPE